MTKPTMASTLPKPLYVLLYVYRKVYISKRVLLSTARLRLLLGAPVTDPQIVQIQSGNNIGAQLELQANYTTNNVDLAGATPGIFFLRKKGGNYTWPKAAQLAQIRALNAAYHRLSDQ